VRPGKAGGIGTFITAVVRRGAGFLGGAHSVRPRWQGRTRAEAFHFHRMRAREAGALTRKILLEANAVIAGVRSPPSAKWPSDGEKAFRGQTGGRCEGRFSWARASLARVGRFGLGELPTNGLHTSSF
jgi:hypothetical protein